MMRQAFPFAAIVLLVLGGCASPVPQEVYHPSSAQYKMQSVRHWDQLAEEVAARIKNTLNLTFAEGGVASPVIYIRTVRGGEYAKSFRHLLRSRLMQQGISVVNNAGHSDTLMLDYDMQVVRHRDYKPMGEPYSEVILSTTVSMGEQYVFSSSDTYYINGGSAEHYSNKGYNNLQVVGQ